MRRLSLDVVVSEKDELYNVFWEKKTLIHPIRWLPKNTNSVSSEKYCEKQWRYGIQKLKLRETSTLTAPPLICHWSDKFTSLVDMSNHSNKKNFFQALWSLWETTCGPSSRFAFKKEYFHFVNILIIFMKNVFGCWGLPKKTTTAEVNCVDIYLYFMSNNVKGPVCYNVCISNEKWRKILHHKPPTIQFIQALQTLYF